MSDDEDSFLVSSLEDDNKGKYDVMCRLMTYHSQKF